MNNQFSLLSGQVSEDSLRSLQVVTGWGKHNFGEGPILRDHLSQYLTSYHPALANFVLPYNEGRIVIHKEHLLEWIRDHI